MDNNRDLSGPERELSSVTAEMIAAGIKAHLDMNFKTRTGAQRVSAIYLAMRVLDPEWVRLKRIERGMTNHAISRILENDNDRR